VPVTAFLKELLGLATEQRPLLIFFDSIDELTGSQVRIFIDMIILSSYHNNMIHIFSLGNFTYGILGFSCKINIHMVFPWQLLLPALWLIIWTVWVTSTTLGKKLVWPFCSIIGGKQDGLATALPAATQLAILFYV
jgi:hypothetical protein